MRVSQRIYIDREPKEVFALVGDPSRYPDFLVGLTKWKPVTEETQGVGARFRTLMKVGSIEVGGTVEVTRWEEPACIEWTSSQGVAQSGRWLLEAADGGTDLRLEIDYDIGGGLVGRLVDRLAAKTIARNSWATLLAVRRLVEVDEAG
jgi:ribosome-associated toxin RatA of RatAB toxin-antitoxin module